MKKKEYIVKNVHSEVLSKIIESHKAELDVTLQWFEQNLLHLQSGSNKIKKDYKKEIIKEWKTIINGFKQSVKAMQKIQTYCAMDKEAKIKEAISE